jgi:hypothetical protein
VLALAKPPIRTVTYPLFWVNGIVQFQHEFVRVLRRPEQAREAWQ